MFSDDGRNSDTDEKQCVDDGGAGHDGSEQGNAMSDKECGE